jgi:hypothetical protein
VNTSDVGRHAAVGELDIQGLAHGDGARRTNGLASRAADQRETARKNALIAERGQHLAFPVQGVPALSDLAGQSAGHASCQGFEPLAAALHAEPDRRRTETRRDADVARVMGLGIGGERAAETYRSGVEALARVGDERAPRGQASGHLGETGVAALDAGAERAIEAVSYAVQALARKRGQVLGAG